MNYDLILKEARMLAGLGGPDYVGPHGKPRGMTLSMEGERVQAIYGRMTDPRLVESCLSELVAYAKTHYNEKTIREFEQALIHFREQRFRPHQDRA